MGNVVYGSELSTKIKTQLKKQIQTIKEQDKRLPHLVVIFIGNDVGSTSYVKGKEKACDAIGMKNTTLCYDDISEAALIDEIATLNDDDSVDGILVQLPLPKHINTNKVLFSIDPKKDVDGFHPCNIGKMLIGEKTFLPCTPKGIMKMLDAMGLSDLSGKRALVIGRSNIVGKPIAQLLLNANATVTIAHSKTSDVIGECKDADIIVAAVGIAKFVQGAWLKKGCYIIDVGVNRDINGKLCGDVDFDSCKEKAKFITPVPKGVGPMTIAMLLENTMESYQGRKK
ncbi:MAG: bifunctional 5,10-methylenetetrahydrofolate dehydrogenase/5,10-methenyltetrahydrofolate cyclohydrolase [Breznakia sp.]